MVVQWGGRLSIYWYGELERWAAVPLRAVWAMVPMPCLGRGAVVPDIGPAGWVARLWWTVEEDGWIARLWWTVEEDGWIARLWWTVEVGLLDCTYYTGAVILGRLCQPAV